MRWGRFAAQRWKRRPVQEPVRQMKGTEKRKKGERMDGWKQGRK